MIFRRRRTRIELQQTTVRMSGSDICPVVVPPSPPTTESPLARVLSFPTPEPKEPNDTTSIPTAHATAIAVSAKETRS